MPAIERPEPSSKPRDPYVAPMDKLWKSIEGLVLGWFEGDVSYITMWYQLSQPFSSAFRPEEVLRVHFTNGECTVATGLYLGPGTPKLVVAQDDTFTLRVEFNPRVIEWLENDLANTKVTLMRKPAKGMKRKIKSITLVPERAARLRAF